MKNNGASLDLARQVDDVYKRLPSQEYSLCNGLKQPFNATNSGSRKLMHGVQLEQACQVENPEVPIISTGQEDQFGEYSSNFIRADSNYVVVAKIPKFNNNPNIHYWLILLDPVKDELTCIERISYKHITEFYGYLYNNDYLDHLNVGDGIEKGDVIKKTLSYDEYNNRAEGLNMATLYIARELVKEDPIVISESAAKRFTSPIINKIEVMINDNDILLNLYGKEENEYKTFPNIGEQVEHSILCAVRRELKNEEALFSQSWDRLKQIMMSDKKFISQGTVIDIDVFCNNPDKITNSMYNTQVKEYYLQTIDFAKSFVNSINHMIFSKNGERNKLTLSYELQKLYYKCKCIAEGKQYINDKVFNNIIMHIYTLEKKPLCQGDKITDRYGGKGVISRVEPDGLMPHYLKDGKWVPVDVCYSKCTCINRLNDGQLFEVSITHIGCQLLEYCKSHNLSYDQAFGLIYKYLYILNPEQATMLATMYKFSYPDPNDTTNDEMFNRNMFIEQMYADGVIMVSLKPISCQVSIDTIRALYAAFPFINKHQPICVPMQDSNGNYRMVMANRQVVIGYKYIFRLKQLAEEKFSVVSLASTNIRNENSKSRLSKTHNAKFASTPVRIYGEMESSTLTAHLGIDYFYQELMLSSSSPKARRLHQKLLTGDPFEFNIELDEDCTSQSADIGQAYLKTLGLKYRFIKLRKFKKMPIGRCVITRIPRKPKQVIYRLSEEARKDPKIKEQELERLRKEDQEYEKKEMIRVIERVPGVAEQTQRERDYEAKLRRLGIKK